MEITLKVEELSVGMRALLAAETKDPNLLRFLSNDNEVSVIIEVAKNSYTPEEILYDYYKKGGILIKQALASNVNAPKPIWEGLLSEPKYEEVLYALAANTGITEDIMLQLLAIKFGHIAYYLTMNRSATSKVLNIVFQRASEYLRKKIMEHPNFRA